MLRLEGIEKRFADHIVLKNISLSLSQGSLAILVGNNGSGKTTLLRIIAGLLKPSSGTVHYGTKPNQSVRIAYVAHATMLYSALSAEENLQFWNKAYGLNLQEEQILSLLERFGLLTFADQPVRVFSRGMAQKLNLARALMLNPEILLLDEPATGLDSNAQSLLHQELQRVRDQGCLIVLITHDPQTDAALATHMLRLEKGALTSLPLAR